MKPNSELNFLALYLGSGGYKLTEEYTDGMINIDAGTVLTITPDVLSQVDKGYMKGVLQIRSLQDLTPEEVETLAKMGDNIVKEGETYVAIKEKDGFWQVWLNEDYGHVWVIDNKTIFSQFQTVYLLRIGVDAFHLIKTGKAERKIK